MLIVGLAIMAVGIGAILGGRFGIRLFRDSQDLPPSTISGGAFLGATWAYRLGIGMAIVGAVLLAIGGLLQALS